MNIKEKLKQYYIVKRIILIKNILKRKINQIKFRKYVDPQSIQKFKNTKCNKRCFIIGNGPSLTLEDLNMLIGEDSFATNSIYKVFENTNWRPTYYVSQDTDVLEDLVDDIGYISRSCEHVFLNSYIYAMKKNVFTEDNIYPFLIGSYDGTKKYPGFSEDISKMIMNGYTVTYACIQMAVYMGYSDIYIIGCDHNYSSTRMLDGTVKNICDVKQNYMTLMDHKLINIPQLDKTTLAYEYARKFCEDKNIKIYNCTRGGKLEAFERKCLDDVFRELNK